MPSTGATGVPTNNRVPSVFLSIAFGASPNGTGGGPLKCLLLGFKTSSGTGIVDTTIYQCLNGLSDALNYAGQNSMAYLMAQAAYTMAPAVDLYLGFPAEPSGAIASATITIGASDTVSSTGSGNITVTVGGVPVVIGVAASTPSVAIATAVKNALNTAANGLPVNATTPAPTADNTVIVAFKHVGALGNQVPISVTADSGIGLTVTVDHAYLGGTVAGAGVESLANILSVSAAAEYDIIFACSQDATNWGRLKTNLDTQYTALVGLPGQGIVCYNSGGSVGGPTAGDATNFAACVTLMSAINDPIMQVLYTDSPTPAFIVGAGWAARRSVLEGADPTTVETQLNPSVTDLSAIMAPPASPALYMKGSTIISALQTGITPITTTSAGDSVLVRSITSHYQDASNNPDARTLDTIQVSVPFAFAKLIQSDFPQSFGGSTLVDNPAPGADKLPPGTVYPEFIKVHYHVLAKGLSKQANPWITNVDADYANWVFNLDATVPGRVDATMPITPVQWVAQFSAAIQQLTLL